MANYCLLDEVKREIKGQGLSVTDEAAILERIPRASALIDGHCGHSFYQESISNERVRGEQIYLDSHGNLIVSVKKAFVRSVSLVSISRDMRAWAVMPLDALDINKHVLTFVNPSVPFYRGEPLWAMVSYDGGYTDETLPLAIKHAAVRWTSFLYHKRDAPFEITSFPSVGQITIPSAVPSDIVQLLEPFVRVIP